MSLATPAETPDVLDDVTALTALDPGEMLVAVASAPAQLRAAAFTAAEVDLGEMATEARPRALVVAGMGGSAVAGDVLAAVAGAGCATPVVTSRGYGLPGWVGAADLVVLMSCSGTTEETLSAADEAVRRGCRVVTVGAAGSPLAERASAARAPHFDVPTGRPPRASLWSLVTPLLVVADRLGLISTPADALSRAVDLLDGLTERYKPSRESFLNPAKSLAVALAGGLPVVWGTSALAGVAASRFCAQLAENAKRHAVAGVMPEAGHNQVVALDTAADAPGWQDPRLVLLRDVEEHPAMARRAAVVRELADAGGIPIEEAMAEGVSPLERIASLIALGDFASVYLALLLRRDPTPVRPIDELKRGIQR